MIHDLSHLLSDPSHWIGHVVMDVAVGLVVYKPFAALVRRHDRKVHNAQARPIPAPPAADHSVRLLDI